jgi:putative sigma-54 modulation protein
MKDYIEKKAGKFTRYFDRIQEVQVVIEQVKFNYELEFILKADLFTIQAREKGTDLRSIVDQATHVIERKLKKEKDKIIKQKQHSRETVRRVEEIEESLVED